MTLEPNKLEEPSRKHIMITVSPKRVKSQNPLKKCNLVFSKALRNQSKTLNNASFFNSVGFVVALGQCFALMPVYGIRGHDIRNIHFKWLSLKVVYSVFLTIGSLTTTALYIVQFVRNDKDFEDIVNIIFFLSAGIVAMLFIKLATKWLTLNEKWLNLEYFMRSYPFQPNILKRYKITTTIVMLLALGEHLLSTVKNIHKSHKCPNASVEPLKAYFGITFSNVFSLLPYNICLGFIMEVIIILATFAWNFSDLFVMLMCAGMAERFRQLNKKVKFSKNKTEIFWKEVREDYTKLSVLCKSLDDAICHLVSLSFGNNLFFICVQLFHTLKPLKGAIEKIYFFASFGFLVGRTIALSIYCCWINDESKYMLLPLFEISSEDFGTEANRLIQQISFSPVAITGSNYFSVTRGLCLQVAGAVITFELILVQLGPILLKTDKEDSLFCIK